MKPKVWIVSHSGNIQEEVFDGDVEATNCAKARSKMSFCSIYRTTNNKMFIYEHGELVNAARKAEISKQVEDIIIHSMERETKQGRSSKSMR